MLNCGLKDILLILLITTKGSPNKVREIVPYSVTMGTEEMYLYLLCQEEDEVNHRMKAGVYALHHIENVSFGRSNGVLEPQIKTWLDCMTKKGPQYSINEDTEICVRLNDKGVKDYRKIYFGRPQCDEVRVENGYHYLTYRNCSMNQLYLYYRRFDPDNAEIIAPNELRERLHEFFHKGESTYKATKDGNTGTEKDEHG